MERLDFARLDVVEEKGMQMCPATLFDRDAMELTSCARTLMIRIEMSAYKIETFADLTKLLREKPEWLEELRRLVLTDELLALPRKFEEHDKRLEEHDKKLDDLSQKFEGFVVNEFKPLKSKVEKIESDVEVLKRDVKTLKADVEVLKQDVKTLKADVEVLKQDVGSLKADVEVLKQDVKTLKADVEVLKQDVKTLKADVEVLKQDVKMLKSDVADLKGESFERRVRERAPSYFGRLIKGCKTLSAQEVAKVLEDAVDKGLISEDEKESALELDVVVTGLSKKQDRQEVVVACEVSVTAHSDDIERAFERASILSRAFAKQCIPVVIAKESAQEAFDKAQELGVVLV
jgi:archaellum component FlaC